MMMTTMKDDKWDNDGEGSGDSSSSDDSEDESEGYIPQGKIDQGERKDRSHLKRES